MRIVFLGTPSFAVPVLDAIVSAGYDVVGVVSQPDRPKDRGKQVQMTPVKERALSLGIPVYQFESLRKEGVAILESLHPDVCVTAAFGQILSQEILDIPPKGTINVHASLLPKYRGSSPIQWAVISGEKATGVTTMLTALGVDTGDILLQEETDILPDETAGQLMERLSFLGAELLVETLQQMNQGTLQRTKQDDAKATHFPMLKKLDGFIDFQDADAICNRVRGVSPWPGAFATMQGQTYKILACKVAQGIVGGTAGQVLYADEKHGVIVSCQKGAIEIVTIQAPGSKPMPVKDFLRGRKLPLAAFDTTIN